MGLLLGGLLAAPGLARAGADKENTAQATVKQQAAGAAVQPPPGGGGFKGIPAEFIKGKVTKFDADDKKVTIEMAKKGDLTVGQSVMIVGKGATPLMRGKVTITEVKDTTAIGKLEGAQAGAKGAPEAGDQVVAPPTGPFDPSKGFPGFGKGAKATVKSVDKDKETVVLTVAGDSGIKVGQTYMAVKMGAKPQPLGLVKVKELSGKELTGQVMKFKVPGAPDSGMLEANQEIILMPLPPGFPVGGKGPFPPPKKDE
jgi:hypothetical protein